MMKRTTRLTSLSGSAAISFWVRDWCACDLFIMAVWAYSCNLYDWVTYKGLGERGNAWRNSRTKIVPVRMGRVAGFWIETWKAAGSRASRMSNTRWWNWITPVLVYKLEQFFMCWIQYLSRMHWAPKCFEIYYKYSGMFGKYCEPFWKYEIFL